MDKATQTIENTSVVPGTLSSADVQIVQKLQDTVPPPQPKLIPIGNCKFVKVCKYRGNTYVNIRDYIKGDTGRFYSTKRGVLLTPSEWKILKKSVKDIDKELKNVKY